MMSAPQFWDKIADKYSKQPVRDMEAYAQTRERPRTDLGPQDRVLELGCGTGTTALKLAGNVGSILATDVSTRMGEIGREKARAEGAENVQFAVADVLENPAGEEQFDVVLAFNLLHLLPNADEAIAHVATLVKPGGVFISKTVTTPGRKMPLFMRLMLLVLPVMQMLGKAPFVKFRSQDDLHKAIERAGFKILETGNYPVAPPNHFVVARRV